MILCCCVVEGLVTNNEGSFIVSVLLFYLGPAKSKELYDIGVRSIADLKDHATKLTHAQRVGVKYFNDFELRIPRSEVRQVLSMFSEKVSALDKNYLFDVCGSYRLTPQLKGFHLLS